MPHANMLLTEEEAKTKWCPMTRVAVQTGRGPVTVNDPATDVPYEHKGRCVASGCMMWRAVNFLGTTDSTPHARGHCGLAPLPPMTYEITADVSAADVIRHGFPSSLEVGD